MDVILKCVKLSLDKLCFQWKTACMMVLTVSFSLVACGMMGFYQKVYDYSEESCRSVLAEDLENTGMIYAKNGGYQSEGAMLFMRDAVNEGTVTAIGCTVTLMVDRLQELARIQSVNEKVDDRGLLQWTYVDETFLDICSPKFAKVMTADGQTDKKPEDEGETRFSLYLGYNFIEIPVGTCYYEKISEEKTYVYEVRGIFEKGERFLLPEMVNGQSAGTGASTIPLDNQVMFCGSVSPPSAFWMYSFQQGGDGEGTRTALKKLAEKRGLDIEFSSLKATFDYARMKSGQMQAVFGKLFAMVSAVALLISFTVFVAHFLKNARDYGILYADGFSSHELQLSCVLENVWQCMIALILAEAVVYFAGRAFFGGMPEGTVMVNYVFWHYLLPFLIFATVLAILIVSAIPVMILGSVKPITLLRGEKT